MLKAKGLEYEATGDGEAVLLIHGALIADAMLPLAREDALSESYRLIRYRRRGHGRSDSPPSPFSIRQQAGDALALMRHLGVERAHVIGHSGGGTIGVELASEAPGRVHTLVVLEPAIMPTDSAAAFARSAAPVLEVYRSGDTRRALDQWMDLVRVSSQSGWRDRVAKTVPGGAEQAEKDAGTFFEIDFPAFRAWSFDRQLASRIRQPILYLMGGDSGPRMEAGKQHFMSLIPHSKEVVVPGVDHSMPITAPRLVAAHIADFLARHPL